jgi:Peptide N-acetyl-beta-D-glucosaminyl asparaginase amidase A
VLNLQQNGSTAALSTPTEQLAATFTLPTNVERAFLDVYAQNQSGEEFWYADIPDQQIANVFYDTFSSPYKEAEDRPIKDLPRGTADGGGAVGFQEPNLGGQSERWLLSITGRI